MSLDICKDDRHEGGVVVYDHGECPACQALAASESRISDLLMEIAALEVRIEDMENSE